MFSFIAVILDTEINHSVLPELIKRSTISLSTPLRIIYVHKLCVHSLRAGIHLEKDMSVPFGHTVARTVCLFEILCAPKSVECAFFEIVGSTCPKSV